MRLSFLDVIEFVCPFCIRGPKAGKSIRLKLTKPQQEGDDVRHGILSCPSCGRGYPIVDGVAIFSNGQGPSRYEDPSFARAYLQTHFRDIIRNSAAAADAIQRHDRTGFYSGPEFSYYADLAEMVSAGTSTDGPILDMGCSVGRLSLELGRTRRPVVGVEPSLAQVRLARDVLLTGRIEVHFGERGVSATEWPGEAVTVDVGELLQSDVEFIVADEGTLPFRNETFGTVCCSAVVDRVPDARSFLSDVGRVVRQEGVLTVTSPFDWDERYVPKQNWLGHGGYGTRRGPSELALEQLMKRANLHLVDPARWIPWRTLREGGHHHDWDVYAGAFQKCEPEFTRVRGRQVSSKLVNAYQRVWREAAVYQEEFTEADASAALTKLDVLFTGTTKKSKDPMGFVGGTALDDRESRHSEATGQMRQMLGSTPVFYIDELGVLPEYAGAGIAKQLLQRLMGKVAAEGFCAYMLGTTCSNTAALSLYEGQGFSRLIGPNGLITVTVSQERVGGETKSDVRLYLYRVDDFARVSVRDGREVLLRFVRPGELSAETLISFAEQISRVFGRSFARSEHPSNPWLAKSVMQHLADVPLAALAFDASSREPIGYALVDRVEWKGTGMLFIDSIALSDAVPPRVPESWQGLGLGNKIVLECLRRLPAQIVAARTQNPAVERLLRNFEPERLLSFDETYRGEDQEMLRSLVEQVAELRGAGNINYETGVCRDAYGGRHLIEEAPDRSAPFHRRMRELDPEWQPEGGDAVILSAVNIGFPK